MLLLASIQILLAFSPIRQAQRLPVRFALVSGVRSQPTAATSLWMADDNENEELKAEESEAAAKSTGEGVEEPEAEEPKEEPEAEEPKEDPEILALKEEIAELESTQKNKKRALAYTQEQVEEYSKAGYARKVAEMENMRRARSVSKTGR
jgi:TATA-binding protein-associated factor Taf7